MTILKYKDYQASVEFADGTLIIQLLHIDDFITAECENASEVERVFHQLVEDYLAMCCKVGKEPCKPFKGTFNVRIQPELHKQLAMEATKQGISLNALVELAIKEKVLPSILRIEMLQDIQARTISNLYLSPRLPAHRTPEIVKSLNLTELYETNRQH